MEKILNPKSLGFAPISLTGLGLTGSDHSLIEGTDLG